MPCPRSRPYNKDYRPQLRNTLVDEPTTPGSVGLEVHAFILSQEKLLAWARRHRYLPNEEDEDHRASQAFIQITQRLGLPIHDDLVAIMVGPPDDEEPMYAAVLGTNDSEESINRAVDPARIERFKKKLRLKEEPLWYTGPFYRGGD
ncbi:hypothetical protein Hypma_002709 [Hypsizygus marmoreus]|uniref:Uncharacterized protein n=1 Tax=Hypsizygus marmoreus TaxID=39966 RepID=A0A369JCD4_HYPMA|nr:hypothetical protein Hypma_002709 [Hypsizygus marmoreus]